MSKDNIKQSDYAAKSALGEEQEPHLCDLPQMAGQTLYERLTGVPAAKFDPEILRQLEILRGEPTTFVDIHNIPCQEISADTVREIEPHVSVVVITYNQEKFISDALEGILCQKTSFPFEIVVSEDCSTDKTREIVLEYQKRFPDVIRVLVSKYNLSQNNSSNIKRAILATRGKYIAFCEGDDYWIDEKKLEKQVGIFKNHIDVNAIYTDSYYMYMGNRTDNLSKENRVAYHSIHAVGGVFNPADKSYFLAQEPPHVKFGYLTCSSMFRRSLIEAKAAEDPLDAVKLSLGDLQLCIFSLLNGALYYLKEPMAVYRIHPSSLSHHSLSHYVVERDGLIVELFYLAQYLGVPVFCVYNFRRIRKIIYMNFCYKIESSKSLSGVAGAFGMLLSFSMNSSVSFMIRLCLMCAIVVKVFRYCAVKLFQEVKTRLGNCLRFGLKNPAGLC